MSARDLWDLLKTAGQEWWNDKAPRLGAALAYYTVFSMAPLLLILVAILGLVLGPEAAQGQLLDQLRDLMGEEGGQAVQEMIASANQPSAGIAATVIGVVLLLAGATGLFGQLQDALDTVWEVQPKPGRGILGLLKDRFLSFSMVLGTAFLLLVSLVVSAALAALSGHFGEAAQSVLGQVIHFVVSLLVVTGLFAMIYKFLPDARIAWRDVWLGAFFTAALFSVGKLLIGLYIGHSSIASSFGAAGSLAVLLIWLYYSAQIFLFGAELTHAYADKYGSGVVPAPDAVAVDEATRAQEGRPSAQPEPQPQARAG